MLAINGKVIKWTTQIKFLGVLLVEHLSWKNHISAVENKVSKNIGILHKAKNIFSKRGLETLYFSFGHSYLNYENIACGSTTRAKLKKLSRKQRQVIRAIYPAEYTREKMEEMKVLIIYKLNIYQLQTFMFKIKRDSAPAAFGNDSKKYLIGILQDLVKVTSQKIIFCQTKQNLLCRLEVQGSGIDI